MKDIEKARQTPLNAVRAFESAARLLSYTKAASANWALRKAR